MISAILSRLVILLFGTLYPAYASYKAVRTKNVKEYVKWMMYWIVFALFTCAETFTDVFLSFWFPFYYEIKIIIVIWLLSPATKGSSMLYRNFVHPVLSKREQEIDEYISKAKEQGYHTMLDLGSKGVTYATNVIMQTAIKGGGGIVNHLRRSYSLSDLSDDSDLKADLNRNSKLNGDAVDSADIPRDPRTRTVRKPGGSHVDLYFPEMDVDIPRSHHPHELPVPPLSQIRSSEDISSGYSSAEPLYGEGQVMPEGNPLMRTSSVGATRGRARVGRTAAQPKKALTTEEEEDVIMANCGWQHALPPVSISLLPQLFNIDPSHFPRQEFLSPEALKIIYTNSLYNCYDPHLIHDTRKEVVIEYKDVQNVKEDDIFEDAEQEESLEENEKITEPSESFNYNKNTIFNNVTIINSDSNSHSLVYCEQNNMNETVQEIPAIQLSDCKSVLPEQIVINDNKIAEANFDEEETICECFEDASDKEVVYTVSDEKKEIVNSQNHIDIMENNTLEPTAIVDSVFSLNDQCFEDSLPDVAMGTGVDSQSITDRKGKYNKGRAPLPPDIKKNEETGMVEVMDSELSPNDRVVAEPALLLRSTPICQPSATEPDLFNELNVTNEDNVKLKERLSNSLVYENRDVSPTPSQSKKDNSNLSKFLPKSGVGSLFNFLSSKPETSRGKSNTNISKSSSNTSMISSSPGVSCTSLPAHIDNNEFTPEANINASTNVTNTDNTPKLRLRQMSQSPSRRRYNYD